MATPKRIPSFQMYAHAWLGSLSVEMMPPEVEGTYIRLLCKLWVALTQGEGSILPTDPKRIRVLTKLSEAQWKKAWPLLEPHFPVTDDGDGRVNPTLLAVWREREAFAVKQRANGESGGRPPKNPHKPPTKAKRNPEETQAFPDQNPSESSVSVSGTAIPHPTDVGYPLSAPENPALRLETASEPPPRLALRAQYDELCAVALPYQRAALDYLLSRTALPDTLVGMVHAIGVGMQPVHSDDGATLAGIEHTMLAVAEMATKYYDDPAKKFSRRLLEECVRFVVNQKPKPTADDERKAATQLRLVAPTLRFDEPETPEDAAEAARQRRAALRDMWLKLGSTDKAKLYEEPAAEAVA